MKKIENFIFNNFKDLNKYGEPYILNSFLLCVANVFQHIKDEVNPVWLMGSSAFAFRICIEEIFSPAAVNLFEYTTVIPETIKQSGRGCIFFNLTDVEADVDVKIGPYEAIIKELDKNIPSIVCDNSKPEWQIIIGYDDDNHKYLCNSYDGGEVWLPYEKLEINSNNNLLVAILGKRNERKRDEVIENSLRAAIRHAEGKESIGNSPKHKYGISAYELWIRLFERWAWLIESGKIDKLDFNIISRAKHNAEYYFFARVFATKYLSEISGGNVYLIHALDAYKKAAENLKQLWNYFNNVSTPRSDDLLLLSGSLRSAKESEEEGIEYIKKYLSHLSLNH